MNDLETGIKADTPVDTGRAQAGWEQSKVIKQVGDKGVLKNDVPYIGWLEYGTDRQPPNAMVRNTIQKIESENN
jgi:hypothetical protein